MVIHRLFIFTVLENFHRRKNNNAPSDFMRFNHMILQMMKLGLMEVMEFAQTHI